MKYKASVEGGGAGAATSNLLWGGETIKTPEHEALAVAHQRLRVAVDAGKLLPTIEILEPLNIFQRIRHVANHNLAQNNPMIDWDKYSNEYALKKGKYRVSSRTAGLPINYTKFEPTFDKHGYVISHYNSTPMAIDLEGNVWVPGVSASHNGNTIGVIMGQGHHFEKYAPIVAEAISKRIIRELEHPQFGSPA